MKSQWWIAVTVFNVVALAATSLSAQEAPQWPRPTPGALRRASGEAPPPRAPIPVTRTALTRTRPEAVSASAIARTRTESGFALRGPQYSADFGSSGWSYRRQTRRGRELMLLVYLESPFHQWSPEERQELMQNQGVPFCEEDPFMDLLLAGVVEETSSELRALPVRDLRHSASPQSAHSRLL